ncbi:hypothetical protein C0Q70_18692 [Pomacea canaliculata]|uniref:Meckelin n=1 Tax=Pomacea canaliculata TaxID=400727 RepID=A0A2T7NHA8_POMCA|nr:hypothetical protein C0Q70_18692 [Pomacea canaliculata]
MEPTSSKRQRGANWSSREVRALLEAGGFCFPSNVTLITGDRLFEIPSIEGTDNVKSSYFQANLQAAHTMCKEYGNVTACQIVANLCVLILYNEATGRICSAFKQLEENRVSNLPQLYFTGYASDVIDSQDISDSYTMTPPMTIPFVAVIYSLNGKYLKTEALTDGLLQLCDTTATLANAAYVFGTYYSYSCSIKALKLWNTAKYPLYFYDIYLKYTNNGQKFLYKVPLRFLDLRKGDILVNQGQTRDWVVTRRMFLVDNLMTVEPSQTSTTQVAKYVRYAKDITIYMALQDGTTDGKIKIPYFTIKYAEVSRQSAEDGAAIQVSFSVQYTMSWSKYYRDFQISCGTLGTLSMLYAGYRTWVWSKRAGRPAIDFPSIVNFFFFLCGAMSNCFFVIAFGVSFYWFIFFKRQDAVYLLHPDGGNIEDWLGLAAAAFALRCLSLIHMIVMQCTVDIFFMDWERPRGISRSQDGKKTTEVPVTIWRTFFVANEWNEIQATRKINKVFQIFATVFFLEVVGFVNTTTKDPDGTINKSADGYQAEQSFIYRFALAVLVYLVIGVVQWIFFTFIYERFVEDQVQQFVDLCSMSNISVFIMSNAQFGFYIHGRSVHGKADADMQEICEMMKREEENLCGQRGLVPDTEAQTFMMSIPRRLRLKYDQVYLPAALEAAGAVGRMEQGRPGSRLSSNKEKSIEAYNTLNKFLCAFIDHSLRDVDYVVKDKTLLESIMDTEFFDASEKGIFYNDNGHSFDQILFYGNEMSLLLFDVLLFCMVDFIWMNYVLDGVITYIITEVAFLIGTYAGIYVDQHYKLPKVDEPSSIWNRIKEFSEQYKKDNPGSSKGD